MRPAGKNGGRRQTIHIRGCLRTRGVCHRLDFGSQEFRHFHSTQRNPPVPGGVTHLGGYPTIPLSTDPWGGSLPITKKPASQSSKTTLQRPNQGGGVGHFGHNKIEQNFSKNPVASAPGGGRGATFGHFWTTPPKRFGTNRQRYESVLLENPPVTNLWEIILPAKT